MILNKYDGDIQIENNKQEIKLIYDVLSDNVLDTHKDTWVFLTSRIFVPTELKKWLDRYRKLRGVPFSRYIRRALIDRQKTKRVFIKLIEKQNLSDDDYKFIEQIINE